MKVVVVGAGPAGLYAATLLRAKRLADEVTVLEKRALEDPGWGLVYPPSLLDSLRAADPASHEAIRDATLHWSCIDVHLRGEQWQANDHEFCGVARSSLLQALRARAQEVGVKLLYNLAHAPAAEVDALIKDAEWVVAADGVGSQIREAHSETFASERTVRGTYYVWLGTRHVFRSFNFAFVESKFGVLQAHAYPYGACGSTFIVECDPSTWTRAGFGGLGSRRTLDLLEELFAGVLNGSRLELAPTEQNLTWCRFVRVEARRWCHRNMVLIGDAAHTTHFSIGSGTALALEDAIALTDALSRTRKVSDAFELYQAARVPRIRKFQALADNSLAWFESVSERIHWPIQEFARSLLLRAYGVRR